MWAVYTFPIFEFSQFRCTNKAAFFGIDRIENEPFYYWIRSKVRHLIGVNEGAPQVPLATDDERLHRWLLVYASDAVMCMTVVRPHTTWATFDKRLLP